MRSKNKTFFKSFKYRENLLASPKLTKFALRSKKKKWAFLKSQRRADLYKISTPVQHNPLQRISRSFALNWKSKQSFKNHFLVQRETHIKRFRAKAEKFSKFSLQGTNLDHAMGKKNLIFLSLWESRLDVLLWRSCLVPTIPTARELIRQGSVLVNNKKITKPSKTLEDLDLVQILPKGSNKATMLTNMKEFNFYQTSGNPQSFKIEDFPMRSPPFYLEVHFSGLSFVYTQPQLESILYPYPVANLFSD